ncbi:MAG: hypothetical protein HRT58_12990 [Crocinitomicaceae bacterium]|nr:hypothetical protein [Flavobacteriales bacterium]NQZ36581.1 hypothetical protein [Crocinitomicaceae bacterium]
MEQYYSNDSLTAFTTEDGIYIEEKKKGSLKMLLVILGLGVLFVVGAFIIALVGGTIGRGVAPAFFWGGILIAAVALIAFFVKLAIQSDPKITFNTGNNELSVRGKVFAFSDIEEIAPHMQLMMGRTMIVAFIMTGGKKKSLFSTSIVVSDPKEMEGFISNLNDVVQKGKNKTDAEV